MLSLEDRENVTMDRNSRARRDCFLPAIPEHDEAADLLGHAATALIAGDHLLAREFLRKADIRVLHDHARRIMGKWRDEIHGPKPDSSEAVEATSVTKDDDRMPDPAVEEAIYRRDGYRCRYCGTRVVLKEVRGVFSDILPDAVSWPSSDKSKHGAFYALHACVDHVSPHAYGGKNDCENLVTACWPCNFGKSDYTLDDLGLSNPFDRLPKVDEWDGLARVLSLRPKARRAKASRTQRNSGRANRQVDRSKQDLDSDSWFAGLNKTEQGLSSRLIALIESCSHLGVSWRLRELLIVTITVGGKSLQVFGVRPGGEVEIPWYIGEEKEAFQAFATKLARAIPGAIAYETKKMWRVKGSTGLVSASELMAVEATVRQVLEDLYRALSSQGA